MTPEFSMFMGFLITIAIIFVPLILGAVIGIIWTTHQIKTIDKEMEDLFK